MKKLRGFTLIELLITILILSILAGVAGPSFLESFDRRKATSAAEQLYSYIQLARSESLTRSTEINISFSKASKSSWAYGLSEGNSCDPTKTTNTDANACFLTIDDGDGNYVPANDNVLFLVDSSAHEGINISQIENSIVFDPTRGTASEITNIIFTSELGAKIKVKVGLMGTVKLCSDDIPGYKSC